MKVIASRKKEAKLSPQNNNNVIGIVTQCVQRNERTADAIRDECGISADSRQRKPESASGCNVRMN